MDFLLSLNMLLLYLGSTYVFIWSSYQTARIARQICKICFLFPCLEKISSIEGAWKEGLTTLQRHTKASFGCIPRRKTFTVLILIVSHTSTLFVLLQDLVLAVADPALVEQASLLCSVNVYRQVHNHLFLLSCRDNADTVMCKLLLAL